MPGGHLNLRHGRVQQVDGSIPLDQGHGRLLPHPFHPGDVVAGIPHEGFQIDNVDGPEAVLLLKGLPGVISRVAVRPMRVDTSLTVVVSVTNWRESLSPVTTTVSHPAAVSFTEMMADEVVRLPSVQLVHGDVQGREDLLQDGHLTGQLVGIPLRVAL